MPGEEHIAHTTDPNVVIVFHEPVCRPGSPEAARHGCTCSFEGNLDASIDAAADDEELGVAIREDCPLHEIRWVTE